MTIIALFCLCFVFIETYIDPSERTYSIYPVHTVFTIPYIQYFPFVKPINITSPPSSLSPVQTVHKTAIVHLKCNQTPAKTNNRLIMCIKISIKIHNNIIREQMDILKESKGRNSNTFFDILQTKRVMENIISKLTIRVTTVLVLR